MAKLALFEKWLEVAKNVDVEKAERLYESVAPWGDRRTCMMLNFAVSQCLEDKEVYLEVGTFCGGSLAGAMLNNKACAHVVDPLDLSTANGPIFDQWNETVDANNLRDRVTLHRTKCETLSPLAIPTVGVYFYDGNHDSGHTHQGLKRFEERLANNAIVVVDDYFIGGGIGQTPVPGYDYVVGQPVKIDTDRWVQETPEATLLWVSGWYNGQAVIKYERG